MSFWGYDEQHEQHEQAMYWHQVEVSHNSMKKREEMTEFKFTFQGREAGAQGVFYFIETTIRAGSFAEAHRSLYECYEHIQFLKLNGRDVVEEVPNE